MNKKELYESIMKSVAKEVKKVLNEDSLDDFDIDGKIAKKRNEVSAQRKQEVMRQIDEFYSIIQKCCKKILSKKYKLIESERYLNCHKYRINYPDLSWGFTYTPGDRISFKIYIGEYGCVESDVINTKTPDNIIKELQDCIVKAFISKGYNISDRLDTWKDSLSGLCSSASFILRINVNID